MSQTQVSFAAHAQRLVCPPPPASANGSVRSLAAPAEPGVGVDTPPVFEGPFLLFRRVAGDQLAGGWEGDWALDWQAYGCGLDAPLFVPTGSHAALSFRSSYVMADGYRSRP